MNLFYFLIGLLFFSVGFTCVNPKEAADFNNLKHTSLLTSTIIPEQAIQITNISNISVFSMNPKATSNPEATSIYSTVKSDASQLSDYLFDRDGNIQFPVLKNIKAAGITKEHLRTVITTNVLDNKLLVAPIVSMHFQNCRVTMLGEVARPTVVSALSEKISFLGALGFADYFTIYAKRGNLLVIGEKNGKKVIKRINLKTSELFGSSYYYPKSNDIVYVERNKAKIASVSPFTSVAACGDKGFDPGHNCN